MKKIKIKGTEIGFRKYGRSRSFTESREKKRGRTIIKKEKQYPIIKKQIKNTKSRKGEYIYIKDKGKGGRSYKLKVGVPIEEYLKAYYGKIRYRRGGVSIESGERKANQYIKKIKKEPSIAHLINKGINETEVIDLKGLDVNKINKAYQKMLSPLVKDKRLLEVLAMPENINKPLIRNGIETTINLGDESANITFKCFGKTLEEVRSDFRNIVEQNKVWNTDVKKLRENGYKVSDIRGTSVNYDEPVVINKINKSNIKLRFVRA